jgi:phage terminase small subunit
LPALDNPRHERFAQELAKGETADAAYATAGYKANRGNAATLKANQNVIARVAEIQERAAMRTEISVATLTDRLMRLADQAERLGDSSGIQASRACLSDAAKLNGLIVDKSKVDLAATVTEVRRTIVDPRNSNS